MNHTKNITAEVISIGDEITSGSIIDTNSAWLSGELADLGIRTLYHTTVGDELRPMVEVFQAAVRRSDLVLITGGIGPTEDDLTRQAVADLMRVPLIQNKDALNFIKDLFQQRNRPMPESNRIQSYFPQGSEMIPNPHGTAPGFECKPNSEITGKPEPVCILVFPGVPAEMKEMWTQTARDRILNFVRSGRKNEHYVRNLRIHTFGLGESEVESRLPHLISREHTPTVGITAGKGIISLRIRAEGVDQNEVEKQIQDTKKIVYDSIGKFIFGEDEDTLPSVVCQKLREIEKKIGVLDWGTRGFLSTHIPKDRFCGSFVFPDGYPFTKKTIEIAQKSFSAGIDPDYLMIVGPYPNEDAPDDRRDVVVGVLDSVSNQWIERSYRFGGHPSMIDHLYCFRAFNLLKQILK